MRHGREVSAASSAEEQDYNAAGREELKRLHARIAPRFGRPEVRDRAGRYLAGLLGPVERRTGQQMAKQIGEESADGVQRLLSTARWDADAVRDDLRDYVIEHLGDPAGALVVVETGFPKKGLNSAGVARQLNPTTGKDENCQVGLFLAYASRASRREPAGQRPDVMASWHWRRVEVDANSWWANDLGWVRQPLAYQVDPGWERWLLTGHSVVKRVEYKYYRAYAPKGTSFDKLARMTGPSLAVEDGLEQAKNEVGLDQYEVRRWGAWHRHITLSLLAHASLQVIRAHTKGVGDHQWPT